MSKISIEQWRMFVSVVDCGGFAQAGDALYKTQSTVSHSIKKLESTLDNSLFDMSGRKAVLTPFGKSLLDSARTLVSHADLLEQEAISQKCEVRNTVSIAADTLFPRPAIYEIIDKFLLAYPHCNIQVYETALSRCGELMEDGTVDIGIASAIPKGFINKLAMTVDLQVVASASHPLSKYQNVELVDLEKYRQVVIRDAGLRNNINSGWLGTNSRITVSTMQEAYNAVQSGLGFAWLPTWYLDMAQPSNNSGLQVLPIQHGQLRTVALQCSVRPEVTELPWVKFFTQLIENLDY